MAAIESGSAAGAVWLIKFGVIKALTLCAAGLGASLMTVFRPPKSRKEMFLQAVVALGSSLLFGNTVASAVLHYISFVNVESFEAYLQYLVSIHGLVGALSWGIFGGFAHLRDKIGERSIDESIKEIAHGD